MVVTLYERGEVSFNGFTQTERAFFMINRGHGDENENNNNSQKLYLRNICIDVRLEQASIPDSYFSYLKSWVQTKVFDLSSFHI